MTVFLSPNFVICKKYFSFHALLPLVFRTISGLSLSEYVCLTPSRPPARPPACLCLRPSQESAVKSLIQELLPEGAPVKDTATPEQAAAAPSQPPAE